MGCSFATISSGLYRFLVDITLAARYRLPAVYPFHFFVTVAV